jgi:hypothetical protein
MWMALPMEDAHEDYYEWLSNKMGNREPWATWAIQRRALRRHDPNLT